MDEEIKHNKHLVSIIEGYKRRKETNEEIYDDNHIDNNNNSYNIINSGSNRYNISNTEKEFINLMEMIENFENVSPSMVDKTMENDKRANPLIVIRHNSNLMNGIINHKEPLQNKIA
eukprot:Pgem_evm1s13055